MFIYFQRKYYLVICFWNRRPEVINSLRWMIRELYMIGYINKQNFRYWTPNNLQGTHEKSVYSKKVIVWCNIEMMGITDPYLFGQHPAAGQQQWLVKYYSQMVQDLVIPKFSTGRNLLPTWQSYMCYLSMATLKFTPF